MAVVLVFVLLFMPSGIQKRLHAEELPLHARSALLMDASNGRVLYEENGYAVMPMASTTKIMTCMLALEYIEENKEKVQQIPVTVSAYAARMPKVHLGMKQQEQYQLQDLLYSLMLESHNDTAVAIAEYVDGSVEAFAAHMNSRAQQLGCKQTFFLTPNGLDAEENGRAHATTAYELAKIAAWALDNETFREIIATREYSFQEQSTGRSFHVVNKDRFLDLMEGAIGIKTGFTGKAGYCFVGALERDGKKLISVVLACGWPPNKTWKWEDTGKLMEYGLTKYTMRDILVDYRYDPVPVTDGIAESAAIYVDRDTGEELTLLLSDTDEVEVRRSFQKKLAAPVKAQCVIGYEKYFINGELYQSYAIRTAEAVELRTYFYCLRQIFMLYF